MRQLFYGTGKFSLSYTTKSRCARMQKEMHCFAIGIRHKHTFVKVFLDRDGT